MLIIIINTFTTAFYASYSKSPKDHEAGLKVLEVCDSIFLGIYTMEFALKVYISPRAFFFNGFNCFDTVVLVLSYSQYILSRTGTDNLGVFKVLRSVRALRPLRSISFVGGLQVIVTALLNTLRTSFLHIITLLSVIMFVFGIMGYYLFGYGEDNQTDWGSFPKSALSLFVLVTAEGWPDIESNFRSGPEPGPAYSWSRVYIVCFLFLGHFIFSNLFVAVLIDQIDEATTANHIKSNIKRKMELERRRRKIEIHQKNEIEQIMKNAKVAGRLEKFRNSLLIKYQLLKNDEFIKTKGTIHCHPLWVMCFDKEYQGMLHQSGNNLQFHRETCIVLGALLTETERLAGGAEEGRDPGTEYCRYGLPRDDRRGAVQHEGSLPNRLKRCLNNLRHCTENNSRGCIQGCRGSCWGASCRSRLPSVCRGAKPPRPASQVIEVRPVCNMVD